jgi:hypothetical protein
MKKMQVTIDMIINNIDACDCENISDKQDMKTEPKSFSGMSILRRNVLVSQLTLETHYNWHWSL